MKGLRLAGWAVKGAALQSASKWPVGPVVVISHTTKARLRTWGGGQEEQRRWLSRATHGRGGVAAGHRGEQAICRDDRECLHREQRNGPYPCHESSPRPRSKPTTAALAPRREGLSCAGNGRLGLSLSLPTAVLPIREFGLRRNCDGRSRRRSPVVGPEMVGGLGWVELV